MVDGRSDIFAQPRRCETRLSSAPAVSVRLGRQRDWFMNSASRRHVGPARHTPGMGRLPRLESRLAASASRVLTYQLARGGDPCRGLGMSTMTTHSSTLIVSRTFTRKQLEHNNI